MKRMWACFLLCVLVVAVVSVRADEQLDRLTLVYEREMKNIEDDFRQDRLGLPMRHVVALRNLEDHFLGEGDNGALHAVTAARKAFVFDPTPSGLAAVSGPEALVSAQQAYRADFAAVAGDRAERIAGLQSQYRSALGRLQVELTRQGQVAAAQQVFARISALEPGGGGAAAPAAFEIEIDLGFDLGGGDAPAPSPVPRPASAPFVSPFEDADSAFDADEEGSGDADMADDDGMDSW